MGRSAWQQAVTMSAVQTGQRDIRHQPMVVLTGHHDPLQAGPARTRRQPCTTTGPASVR